MWLNMCIEYTYHVLHLARPNQETLSHGDSSYAELAVLRLILLLNMLR